VKDPANVRRGRNSKRRSKAIERQVARLYGGKRTPEHGGLYSDVQTTSAVIEVKSHQKPPPKWWREAFEQVREAGELTGKDQLVCASFIENHKRTFYEIIEIAR